MAGPLSCIHLQLELEPGSVFRADSTCTSLPPHSTLKICIHFTPHRPIPYCKRVACLIQHQVCVCYVYHSPVLGILISHSKAALFCLEKNIIVYLCLVQSLCCLCWQGVWVTTYIGSVSCACRSLCLCTSLELCTLRLSDQVCKYASLHLLLSHS